MYYIGIGSSAGGQAALCEFFDHLPSDTSAAYFVITHLLRTYRTRLHEILQLHTRMHVQRVDAPTIIEPNTVYIQTESTILSFEKQYIIPLPREQSPGVNRVINMALGSLAGQYGDKAIGIILSGTGEDGTQGILWIKDHGGEVLVQDPASAQYEGMPESAIGHDDPIAISRPSELATRLRQLLRRKQDPDMSASSVVG